MAPAKDSSKLITHTGHSIYFLVSYFFSNLNFSGHLVSGINFEILYFFSLNLLSGDRSMVVSLAQNIAS